ncbi:MAG TPA: hypothetical protein ENJ87_08895 [Gammaproteobacteria bacterium]|nr:hypothetical protein [Gammaproteobacteria bacterium]
MFNTRYSGAWLTDIDDTLIRSGIYPDDEWIDKLTDFIRCLKAHDIVWVPVSGVALNKMGSRLLFRLPQDVLSHVIYYGGEGGIKSYYVSGLEKWHSPESFQRNFSDAQALVLLGAERYMDALKAQYERDSDEEKEINQRITTAQRIIHSSRYRDLPCLVDQMESRLKHAGFDPERAETYYRGGALSWMMLGDISVQYYRGKGETRVRNLINDFIREKLSGYDHLRDLGDYGIHMPYPHATRGIKLVLMCNDKGRAVKDLLKSQELSVDTALFVGNELYEGGNDNPVTGIDNLTVLSVGKKRDKGVINGGAGVEVNQYWMDALSDKLGQGMSWADIIKDLPGDALARRISNKIDAEKKHAHRISPWHDETGKKIPTYLLTEIYLKYGDVFKKTRKRLLKVKNTQYELVTRLASLEDYHYDNARKIVLELLGRHPAETEKASIKEQVKRHLLPEISNLIRLLLVDHLELNEKRTSKKLGRAKDIADLHEAIQRLIELSDITDKPLEMQRKHVLLDNWDVQIDELVDSYFKCLHKWKQGTILEQHLIATDELVIDSATDAAGDVCEYFRWLISRIVKFPHLKDLDKPTIVLIAGTSGVGKSTISRHISKVLGIPTGFSSDVASRSVIRETITFLLGQQGAEQLFPEVYGSSFDQDTDDWFYAHSLMTMVGVIGNIKRLIDENISAVIDGVALIPGTLPETYFEKANIVWVVARVADKELHYERLGTRSETGVERGGADHYWEQFSAIRRNHDRLVMMAKRSDTFIVDNSDSVKKVFKKVLGRVNDAIADRGLYVEDDIRENTHKKLQERTTWEVHNVVMQATTQG